MKKMHIAFAALVALSGLQAGKGGEQGRQAPASPKRDGAKKMKKTSPKKSPKTKSSVLVQVKEGVHQGQVVPRVLLPFLLKSSAAHEAMQKREQQMQRLEIACDKPVPPSNTLVYNLQTGRFE